MELLVVRVNECRFGRQMSLVRLGFHSMVGVGLFRCPGRRWTRNGLLEHWQEGGSNWVRGTVSSS